MSHKLPLVNMYFVLDIEICYVILILDVAILQSK